MRHLQTQGKEGKDDRVTKPWEKSEEGGRGKSGKGDGHSRSEESI